MYQRILVPLEHLEYGAIILDQVRKRTYSHTSLRCRC